MLGDTEAAASSEQHNGPRSYRLLGGLSLGLAGISGELGNPPVMTRSVLFDDYCFLMQCVPLQQQANAVTVADVNIHALGTCFSHK